MTLYDSFDDFYDAWVDALERRHPGVSQTSFSEQLDNEKFAKCGRLHEALHTAIRQAAVDEFADDAEYLTYQNWDWYGPTYECPVSVIQGHLTPDFLARLQSLLQGEFEDWAIVVKIWGDFFDASTEGGEIVIVSDDVILERKWYAPSGLAN